MVKNDEVLEEIFLFLKELSEQKFSGNVKINFQFGNISNWSKLQTYVPKNKVKSGIHKKPL